MPDPLQALLASGAIPTTSFPPTSRYAGVGVEMFDPGDGIPPVPFLGRRFCPHPERFGVISEVRVVDGDRRDLLAARHVGEVELWWRLADANGVVDPRALTDVVGRLVRIVSAEGVQGGTDV